MDLPPAAELREDVEACLAVWTDLLRRAVPDLESLYAKGSALKPWDGPIDYVPVVSDVDLHLRIGDGRDLFEGSPDAVERARDLALAYERGFHALRPEALHVPRPQIMAATAERMEGWVPPRASQIRVLLGRPELGDPPSAEVVRAIDRSRLEADARFVEGVPEMVVDRVGMGFWTVVRRLTFRVSPAPVRVLTQAARDPLEVWTWNRTRIVEELRREGLDALADRFVGFYEAGWRAWSTELSAPEPLLEMILRGVHVVRWAAGALEG